MDSSLLSKECMITSSLLRQNTIQKLPIIILRLAAAVWQAWHGARPMGNRWSYYYVVLHARMGCWNAFAKIQWTGLNIGRKIPKNTYLASFLTINISQLNHCSPIFNKGLYIQIDI